MQTKLELLPCAPALREPSVAVTVARSDAAQRQLVLEHAPYLWRVLRSLGVREADLPDVVQDTFIVVLRQLPGFEGRSSLRTWIYGIALRVVSDYRDKAHRKRELITDQVPELAAGSDQHAQLERARAWQLIETLLSDLDEDRRRVFVLYELEQLPMREIAEIVGCPMSTGYARLHSAREAVQMRLQELRSQEAT